MCGSHYFPLIRQQLLGGEESLPSAADGNRNIRTQRLHFSLLSYLWNLKSTMQIFFSFLGGGGGGVGGVGGGGLMLV